VAHRQRQRERAAQPLAVFVVELARPLGEIHDGRAAAGRPHGWFLLAGSRRGKVTADVSHAPTDPTGDPAVDPVVPVVILGGGLTGISTAAHLRAPWLLFEREERLGGHARTDERDGYRFDKTGHWLHLRDPAVKNLVDELLPGQMVPIARRARIFSHGVLTRYPYQANLHGLPPEVIKECLLGVIEAKLGHAQQETPGPAPQNFEEYCLRHFGGGIWKHFMIPYNEKIWGVHPREITAAWCSRFVPLPNLDQVIAGAVGAGPPEMGYNQSFLYPKSGGIETFTRALLTRVAADRVHTRSSPDAIDWRRREITVGGERFRYPALVATLPLPALLDGGRPLALAGAAEAHDAPAARDRDASRAPALHDPALPEHRGARAAA